MNKTFKVVFNKARGALMVVNEATSSIQAKGTKTVVAAAVVAMAAGVAGTTLAEEVVYTPLTGETAIPSNGLVGNYSVDESLELANPTDKNLGQPSILHNGIFNLADNVTLTLNHTDKNGTLNGAIGGTGDDGPDLRVDVSGKGTLAINAEGDYVAAFSYASYNINVSKVDVKSIGFGIYTDGQYAWTQEIKADTITIDADGQAIHMGSGATHDLQITSRGELNVTGAPAVLNGSSGAGSIKLKGETVKLIGTEGASIYTWYNGKTSIEAAKTLQIGNDENPFETAIHVGGGTLSLAADTITVNGNIISGVNKYGVGDDSGQIVLKKGDMTVNGTVSGYKGTFTMEGGSLTLNAKTGMFGGDVIISGDAALDVSGVADADLSKTVLNGGELAAALNQIYVTEGGVEGQPFSGAVKALQKNGPTLTSGDLLITDKGEYSLTFLTDLTKVTDNDKVAIELINGTLKATAEEAKTDYIQTQDLAVASIEHDATYEISAGKALSIQSSVAADEEKPTSTLNTVVLKDVAPGEAMSSLEAVNTIVDIGTVKGDGAIFVGDPDGAGATMTIGTLAMNSGLIFVDPLEEYHAHLSIGSVADGAMNVDLVAGNGSLVAVGADLTAAEAGAAKLGLSSAHAVLFVAQQLDMTNGSITVDPTATDSIVPVEGTVTVAVGGALIVDQSAVNGQAFTNASLDVTGGTIGIVNSNAGSLILADEVAGLTSANLVTDNPFIQAGVDGNAIVGTVSAENGLGALASTGIQAMARRADFVLAQTIADRTAVDQELGTGLNLWADVTGERYEADSLDNGGNFTADAGYGAFGADFAVTQDIALGGAIQYGTGSVRSGVSNIKNEIDSYGITAYGSMKFGDAKLVGELAYIKSENDITSSQTALNGKVDADIYSLGVTAQYKLTAGNFSFVPSIGLRVSRLETDAMTIGAVNVDKQKQTLVQVPVALRINGSEMNAAGWNLAPSFKIAYVPTFGDKEIEVLGAEQDVIDTSPVQGEFGLRAVNGNLMLNANLMVGGGKDGTSALGGKIGVKYLF